jgi:hypothetical protein
MIRLEEIDRLKKVYQTLTTSDSNIKEQLEDYIQLLLNVKHKHEVLMPPSSVSLIRKTNVDERKEIEKNLEKYLVKVQKVSLPLNYLQSL